MSIPPRFKDELRNRLNLSEVIGSRIKVMRAGHEYKACCPFHNEKTPSFTINDDKQFYHCFGCGAHGDVINFVMEYDGLPFPEAIELLAGLAGLKVPQASKEEVAKQKKQKDLYALLEDCTAFFENNLFLQDEVNTHIRDYIQQRGMKQKTLKEFRIGFAPADGQALRKDLLAKGYTDQQMMQAGIIKAPNNQGSQKGQPYSFFRERIMFPVEDRRGRVIAFGGRALPDHIQQQVHSKTNNTYKPPKYINTSDTELFDKGMNLYGQSKIKHALKEDHPIIVVEGYMDVAACHQAGFLGALAPMGTALGERQIIALWKLMPSEEKMPILCFDGDDAGRRAAIRAVERFLPLLKPFHGAKIAFLPEGQDPDSLIQRSGKKSFQDVLENAMSIFDFLWLKNTHGRDLTSPEIRAGISQAMEVDIRHIQDRELQRYYQQILREKISQTFFSYRQSGASKKVGFSKAQYQAGGRRLDYGLKVKPPDLAAPKLYERVLLACVINHPFLYESIEEPFGSFDISTKEIHDFRQAIVDCFEEKQYVDAHSLQKDLKNKGFAREIGDILSESVYVHASFCSPMADSGDLMSKWLRFWQDGRQGQSLKQEMKAGWREAFIQSNEQEEEKLRQMMKASEAE